MIIHGYAATTEGDHLGRRFTDEALSMCLVGYMLDGAPIRVNHLEADEAPSVGRVLDFALDQTGLFIVAKITDRQIIGMIEAELFHSFSIAGPFRAEPDGSISRLQIEEISICDNPSCKGTRFQIWKEAGTPAAFPLIERLNYEKHQRT